MTAPQKIVVEINLSPGRKRFMKILVINAGSSSLKYQLIDMTDEKVIAKGICERIGIDGLCWGTTFDGRRHEKNVNMPTHTDAFMQVQDALVNGEAAVLKDMSEITAVGHRVVQGGAIFSESVLVDDKVIADIESLSALAPLHNPAHVQGIRACLNVLGPAVPEVVVFDTAFHATMPPEAYMFAVPYRFYEKYGIRRYGFHGTSHRYISMLCAERMHKKPEELKIITCHLGNGSSITAIKQGRVVDTSMGLTPLDGFMMGTRSGSLDPSVVCYLLEEENLTANEMAILLNRESGMLGISGVSSDDRDITKAIEEGNERAKLARAMQFYQIRKFIGSYIAAMNGVDAICFTGGIGENSFRLRRDVCENLTFLGIRIDEEKNNLAVGGREEEISTPDSTVRVFVLPTNEELVIARDTKAVVEKQQ